MCWCQHPVPHWILLGHRVWSGLSAGRVRCGELPRAPGARSSARIGTTERRKSSHLPPPLQKMSGDPPSPPPGSPPGFNPSGAAASAVNAATPLRTLLEETIRDDIKSLVNDIDERLRRLQCILTAADALAAVSRAEASHAASSFGLKGGPRSGVGASGARPAPTIPSYGTKIAPPPVERPETDKSPPKKGKGKGKGKKGEPRAEPKEKPKSRAQKVRWVNVLVGRWVADFARGAVCGLTCASPLPTPPPLCRRRQRPRRCVWDVMGAAPQPHPRHRVTHPHPPPPTQAAAKQNAVETEGGSPRGKKKGRGGTPKPATAAKKAPPAPPPKGGAITPYTTRGRRNTPTPRS